MPHALQVISDLNKQPLSASRQLVSECTEAYPIFTAVSIWILQHFKFHNTFNSPPPSNHISHFTGLETISGSQNIFRKVVVEISLFCPN